MRYFTGLAISALAVVLAACSNSDFRAEHRTLATSDVLATDAGARLVTATPIINGVDNTGRFKPHQVNCAEPSPDVAKAIQAAFSSGVSVDVSGQQATTPEMQAKVANAIAASRSEALAQLTERLPTIQLLRDGLFRACEAYSNGALSPISYALVLSRYGDTMVTMLGSEMIAGTYGHQLATAGGSSTAHSSASLTGSGSADTAANTGAADAADGAQPAADGTAPSSDAQTKTVATANAVQGSDQAQKASADVAKVQAEVVRAYLAAPSPGALMTACITALDRGNADTDFARACVSSASGRGLLQQSVDMMGDQIGFQRYVALASAQQLAAGTPSLVDQVIAAQTALRKRGLYAGQIDGLAAGKTIDAVRKFQTMNGLPATGLLDPATMKLLMTTQG
jgi:murein L,D-transpeptidase YcbB/YkuD